MILTLSSRSLTNLPSCSCCGARRVRVTEFNEDSHSVPVRRVKTRQWCNETQHGQAFASRIIQQGGRLKNSTLPMAFKASEPEGNTESVGSLAPRDLPALIASI